MGVNCFRTLIRSKGFTSTSDKNKGNIRKDLRLSSCPLFQTTFGFQLTEFENDNNVNH